MSSSSITSTDFNHNREFHRRNYGQLTLPLQQRVAQKSLSITKDATKIVKNLASVPRSIKRDVVHSIDSSLGLSDKFGKAVHKVAPYVASVFPTMSPHEVSTILSYLPGGPIHEPPPPRDGKRRKKNLLKEGVEPNPGPPKTIQKLQKEIRKAEIAVATHPRHHNTNHPRNVVTPRVPAPGDTGISKHEWNGKSFSKVFDPIGNMSEVFVNHSQARMNTPLIVEKLMDPYGRLVNSSTTFNTSSFIYLNPGNMFMHPVLSKLACLFQKYRYKHLKLMFRTEAYGASGSNVSAGKVMFVVNSDPTDQAFSDSASLQTYPGSVSGPPFTCYVIDLLKYLKKKDMPLKDYYVNYGANSATSNNYSNGGSLFSSGTATGSTGILDPRFINEGWIQIAIEGAQSGELGDVFIESQMELIEMRAVLYTPPTLCSKFVLQFSNSAFNGTNTTLMNMSNFSVTGSTNVSTIYFNAVGFYRIVMVQISNAADGATSGVVLGSNVSTLFDIEGTTNTLNIQGIALSSGNFAVSTYTIYVSAVASINNANNRFQVNHNFGTTASGNVTYDINQTCGAMGNLLTGATNIVAPGPNVIDNRIQLLEEKSRKDEERITNLIKQITLNNISPIPPFNHSHMNGNGMFNLASDGKVSDTDSESDYTNVEEEKFISGIPSEVRDTMERLHSDTLREFNNNYAAKVKASLDFLKQQKQQIKILDSK